MSGLGFAECLVSEPDILDGLVAELAKPFQTGRHEAPRPHA